MDSLQLERMLETARSYGLLRHLNDKKFVLTGTMSAKRDEIMLLIDSAGGQVSNSVRSTVDFLVVPAGPVNESKKTRDAYTYGVKVINEEELVDMILPTSDELVAGVWAASH